MTRSEQPQFRGDAAPIPDAVRREMRGVSWKPDPACPPFDELALLGLDHWGFDGRVHRGELVVAAVVADEVLGVFAALFAARFSIQQMARIEAFGGDDVASMAGNNSSAFNFRIAPSGSLSQHSFGTAIDINPLQNPMIVGQDIHPPAGRSFLDRDHVRPGMIVRPGPVTAAFDAIGWSWGGDWTRIKDYHHFSRTGA